MSYKNRAFLQALTSEEHGAYGSRIVEALDDILQQHNNLAQQVNGNSTGQPLAPPQVSGLKVTGQNGHFNIAISDPNSPIYRDIHYWVEHSDSPHFSNPHVVHMGQSRNHNLFLGNVTRYFRAFSSYSSSPPSAAVYHGSQVAPAPVIGGGSVGGPQFTEGQSSGTGTPGTGLQGPGIAPFRSPNGAPPSR